MLGLLATLRMAFVEGSMSEGGESSRLEKKTRGYSESVPPA